jgi:hypothetical protein
VADNAQEQRVTWEKSTAEKFEKILEQIPALVRGIAETRISKKAESLVRGDNRLVINEKDMVDAFFAETPPGFIPAMKEGMIEVNIDVKQYGYEK